MIKTIVYATSKMNFKKEILLAALVLMVLVVIGTAAYGESENVSDKQESNQVNLLNPFTLEITEIPEEKTQNSSISILLSETKYVTPKIIIPYRPALRSAFRPAL